MKQRVYIETTVVSYLTARQSRDLVVAAHQQVTAEWWQLGRRKFDLFVSQSVISEAAAGDPAAAERRLAALSDLGLLDIDRQVEALAQKLVAEGVVPERAAEDALHIATATVHRMDYLLTWNCRHIANAEIRRQLRTLVSEEGYSLPVICTPEELHGD